MSDEYNYGPRPKKWVYVSEFEALEARALKAEAERDGLRKAYNWADDDVGNLLCDLTLWARRHLENLHARQNPISDTAPNRANGYAVAEVPDWELRQKLHALDIHRAKLDALRAEIGNGK